MGAGKTTWAIQYMNQNPDKKFMYITPYNDEIKTRIIPQCPKLHFKFAREGHKIEDFKAMLEKGQNIVATHECFKRIDDETISLLEANRYILILDEVFDVVIDIKLIKSDVTTILKDYATTENDYLVWTKEEYPDEGGRFSDIKKMAQTGRVMVCGDSLFLWLFPVDIFKMFSEVYIMTYLFAGQIQKYYFDINNVEYSYCKVVDKGDKTYELVEHDFIVQNNLSSLVEIYHGSLNDIGSDSNSLSLNWYKKPRNKPKLKILKNNIRNFFRNIHNAKSSQIMWTCFKDDESKLKGDGYALGFVVCNCRATNKYGSRTHVAYCVNRFMRTMLKNNYFAAHGVDVDEDLWALAEMLQFLWRSAIRNDQKVYLYIPSERMRKLLVQFLDNELKVINW